MTAMHPIAKGKSVIPRVSKGLFFFEQGFHPKPLVELNAVT
jgi:hypothetical protein